MPRPAKRADRIQFKANLPSDVLEYLTDEAVRFDNSVNSELVRAVRERMVRSDAAAGEKFGHRTPAAAGNTAALPGSDIITHG